MRSRLLCETPGQKLGAPLGSVMEDICPWCHLAAWLTKPEAQPVV